MFRRAAEFKMPAVAMTDHGNMFGAIEFYNGAKKHGLKPIIGCEVYVAPESRHDKKEKYDLRDASYHLILLAQNEKGYKNLLKLVTFGYMEGFYYKPRIDKELLAEYAEGLIALSSCGRGEIAHNINKENIPRAIKMAGQYRDIMGHDNFFLELQNHKMEYQEKINNELVKIGDKLSLPLVATNNCHYLDREDFHAHEILLCLQTGKTMSDQYRMRYPSDEYYFKSPEEMAELFRDIPQAIENTLKIAERCELEIDFDKLNFPDYPVPENYTLESYLTEQTNKGLDERFQEMTKYGITYESSLYRKRLQEELDIIERMGYPGYFLIVWDFIDYARRNGIPVGPGRGSAAGSLVAYSLCITDIDPLRYDLLFERFLNPERVSMPDIDIDFCMTKRDNVIKYVSDKYGGSQNVTQIITFGSMNAKGVLRDVGRVLDMSYGEVDKIAKLVPNRLNICLKDAFKEEIRFASMKRDSEKVTELLDIALNLEGLPRHCSTHAAGVVISSKPLTDFLPLYKFPSKGKGEQDEVVTQYSMGSVEKLGLLKMDFLGLRTLTVIDKAVKLIEQKGEKVDIEKLPLDDAKVYEIFAKGLTIGVFQFESSGMREFLKKLKPTVIEDLIAMNALYRPGPMKNIDDFISRKHGQQNIAYPHPLMEPILKETYGIIVYQEQVMQIAHEIAGFTLAEADIMRRAMGKKIKSLMDELSIKFVEGAESKKISKKKAENIFALIEKFAQYGFNKSHSTAYAYVAYQTAWLKTHYTAEFMSANLTSEMGTIDRVVILINECKKQGIEVTPPDINVSFEDFRPVNKSTISYGLNAIKNVGAKALETIIEERGENGKYESIFDLCARVDQQKVNKRVLESLIMSGTMDSVEGNRAQKFSAVDEAIRYGQQMQSEKDRNQVDLFGGGGQDDELIKTPDLQNMADWKEKESLEKEKEVLGLYVTGHPLLEHAEDLEEFTSITFGEEQEFSKKDTIVIGGMVTRIVKRFDRRNREMAFFDLDCLGGHAEVIAFSDCFKSYGNLIEEGNVVFVKGKPSENTDFSDIKIMGDEIITVDRVRDRLSQRLNIKFPQGETTPEEVDELMTIAKQYPGECRLVFHLPNNGSPRPMKVMAHNIKISTDKAFVRLLRTKYGKDNVWVE